MADRVIRAVLTGSSAGAVRAFTETGDAAKKSAADSSKAIDDSSSKSSGAWSKVGGTFEAVAAVAAVAGAAVVGVAVEGIKAFNDEQQAMALLNTAMADTGQKWTPQLKVQLASVDTQMDAFGHTSAETEGALQKLTLAGIPVKAGLSDMGTVANFAATAHLSLADAATAVAKAGSGRLNPAFKEMGVVLPKGEKGVKAVADVLAQLTPKVAGAAAAISGTLGGALDAMKSTVTDKVLVPLGQMVSVGLVGVSGWIGAHSGDISNVLGGAMTGLGNVFSWISSSVMPPLMTVFSSLGSFAATIMPTIQAVGQAFVSSLGQVLSVVASLVPVLLPIGEAIMQAFGTIVSIVQPIVSILIGDLAPAITNLAKTVIPPILAAFAMVVKFVQQMKPVLVDIATVVGHVLSAAFDAAGKIIKGAINALMPLFQQLSQWIVQNRPMIDDIAHFIGTVLSDAFTVLGVVVPIAIKIVVTALTIALNIIGTVVTSIINVVETIVSFFHSGAWTVLSTIIAAPFKAAFAAGGAIFGAIGTVVTFITNLPSNLGNAFKNIGGFLVSGFKGVINNAIINPINTAMKWIGDLGGSLGFVSFHIRDAFGGHMPAIPTLDMGGVVTKPTLAALAMNNQPEAIVPLGRGAGGIGGGGNIYIDHISVVSNDPNAVVAALRRYQQQSGSIPIRVTG